MQFLSKGNNREWYLWINDKWESDEVFAEFSFFKKIFPEEEIKYYGKISDGNLEWWMWIFSFGSQLHGLLTIWCNSCPAIPGFRSTTLLGKTSNWTFERCLRSFFKYRPKLNESLFPSKEINRASLNTLGSSWPSGPLEPSTRWAGGLWPEYTSGVTIYIGLDSKLEALSQKVLLAHLPADISSQMPF